MSQIVGSEELVDNFEPQYLSATRNLSNRIEMLRLRGELTMSNYWLSHEVLIETDLFQCLACRPGSIRSLIVFSNPNSYRMFNEIMGPFLDGCYVLSLPITPKLSVFVQEVARNIADEFSVLLKKLLCGTVSAFPKVVGIDIGLCTNQSYFPGSLFWSLSEGCPIIPVSPPFVLVVGLATDSYINTTRNSFVLSDVLTPDIDVPSIRTLKDWLIRVMKPGTAEAALFIKACGAGKEALSLPFRIREPQLLSVELSTQESPVEE